MSLKETKKLITGGFSMEQKRWEIIERRKSFNLTQQEVANSAGISRSFYAMFEAGKRGCSFKTWIKISKTLKLSKTQFFAILEKEEAKNEQ